MPHSYVSTFIHYIFGTKERFPFIDQELESRLWPYIGGIARENGMKAIAVGTTDHLHTLLSLPSTMSVAKAIQLVKGGSSKWIHDQIPRHQKFCMARWLWSFQRGGISVEDGFKIHREPKGTSPQTVLRRRVFRIS